MKILFIANRLPHADVAGGHRLIYQRMRQLQQRGHTVGLAALIMQENLDHLPCLKDTFYEVEAIPFQARSTWHRVSNDYLNPLLPAIFWKNRSAQLMQQVGSMVERSQYDLVVAEYGEMGQYLYQNPYLSAVHKIISCHRCLTDSLRTYSQTKGVPLSMRLKSKAQLPRLSAYEYELYRNMDHILTLTNKDRFTLLHDAPQLPVSVVAPGIDVEELNEIEYVRHEEPTLVMCGYFADKSNRDAALWFIRHVWPILQERYPSLRCQFVGKGIGHEIKQAQQKYETIELISDVDDLRPYRKKAHIFINPMRIGSGLRIKMLEAMGSGLPVVTTQLGAAGIPAQNGVNCFIADTPELFAHSISWLLQDPTLVKEMGQRAQQLVSDQYGIHQSVKELERIFTDTLSVNRKKTYTA